MARKIIKDLERKDGVSRKRMSWRVFREHWNLGSYPLSLSIERGVTGCVSPDDGGVSELRARGQGRYQ